MLISEIIIVFETDNASCGTKPFTSLTVDLNFLSNPLPPLATNKMEIRLDCKFYPRKTETVPFSYCHGTITSTPKTVVNASITLQKILD